MTEQLTRLFCIPFAIGIFLYAAQISAGLVQRDAVTIQVAMK